MEDAISEFISRYKEQRAEHLEGLFAFRRKRENRSLSDLQLLSHDEDFYSRFLLDAAGLAKLRNAQLTKERWASVILALKNRSEMINSRIDFYNYMHTFLAIALPLFILAGQTIGRSNWIAAVGCLAFIIWLFKIRSELRFELSAAKELVNVFEQIAKGAI